MDPTEKIKDLEKQLAELKAQVEKESKTDYYNLKNKGDEIFYLDEYGEIEKDISMSTNKVMNANESLHKSIIEWALLAIDMHNWAAHYNEEFVGRAWFLDLLKGKISIGNYEALSLNALQFSSKEIAEQFLQHFGKEKIKQYLTRPY